MGVVYCLLKLRYANVFAMDHKGSDSEVTDELPPSTVLTLTDEMWSSVSG